MRLAIACQCAFYVCLSAFVAGCGSTNAGLPQGAEPVAHLSHTALLAYQTGNANEWRSMVCGADDDRAPLAGFENMQRLVGGISNVRLVALSGGSHAGNAGIDLVTPSARYQVTSTKYPLKELVLSFYMTERTDCIGLLY